MIFFIIGAIIGVWGTRTYTDVGDLSSTTLFYVLLFSFGLILYVELASTSNHFYGIKQFASKHNLKKENLNLNLLSGKYLLWLVIFFSIIFFYSWFILDLQNVLIMMMDKGYEIPPFTIEGLSPQFGNSLILNSIYGVMLSIAIIFVPFIIMVGLLYRGKQKEKET